MKKLRTIITILFLSMMLVGMTSCEVSRHSDNGRHRGWSHRHDNDEHKRGAVLIINSDDHDRRSDNDHDR